MVKNIRPLIFKFCAFFVAGSLFTPRAAHAGLLDDIIKGIGDAFVSDVIKAVSSGVSAISKAIDTAISDLFTAIFGIDDCSGDTIGGALCRVVDAADTLPGFISAMAYLIGIIMTISALLKLKEHVLDPRRTPLSDSMKRFFAGAALLTLPSIAFTLQSMWVGTETNNLEVTGYAGSVAGGGGLDTMMVALFLDIYSPMMSLLYGFGYLAGLVLTVVGIMRIIKTAQDGPRGPSGMGTIMTFLVAGLLFSIGAIMDGFSGSIFGSSQVFTYAALNTSSGDDVIDDHILAVISSVLVFMTIIGWISFLRGFFILRDVAEGNGQASLMVSLTHLFGGALAVNLGPLMNAVQSTFGLTPFGVEFS